MSAKENRGGGQTCCVPGCSNNTRKDKNISFHGFPKDNMLKQEWVRRINRQGSEGRFTLWKPSKHHKICGAHFNTSGRKGYMDRLPTIFPHRVYAERTPAVVTGAGKRRRIKRVVAMSQEAYIQDELCICGTVEVESQQHNLSATSPVLLPAASPSSMHPQLPADYDHMYSMGPASEAAHRYQARAAELVTRCQQLQQENEKLRQNTSFLEEEVAKLRSLLHKEKTGRARDKQTTKQSSHIEDLVKDDKQVRFYTGFSSLKRFECFVAFICSKHRTTNSPAGRRPMLSVREQRIICLCRLRVGLLEQDIAFRFAISTSLVSGIFSYWVDFLSDVLVQIPVWPSRETVSSYMLQSFRALYPSTRVILDCTELFIETPSDYTVQGDTFSAYKSHNTAKSLLGITPNGFISFVSDLSPGRISDKEITRKSGLYDLLEPGDSVMADRGFLISDDLNEIGVSLNVPPMLNGKQQFSVAEETKTREIANLRVHVERVIREVKKFRILKSIFPNVVAHKLNKLWKICCYLNNFTNEPLLNRE
ncbi:uncharacterized protein [Dermacentor andersoni]|uniref:uncharacterized protein n=1 Tax=Dermacentor andersoni TaxID=34620 RepID=UPI003B3AA903